MGIVEADRAEQKLGPWAAGRTAFRALVIVNEGAHGVAPSAADDLRREIELLGGEVHEVLADVQSLSVEAAKQADLIIVLGGDGTARAAAETFTRGPPLVLLPGGTLNFLPRALYGQLAWPQALRAALTSGRIARLVGGSANGRKFFVAAVFGAPTLIARAREAARKGRFRRALTHVNQTLRRLMARTLAVRVQGAPARRVEAVGILCPAYSGEIEAPALEWVQLNAANALDYLRLGVRVVLGKWREDPKVALAAARGGEIGSLGLIPATLDGEPVTFLSRVRVAILSRGPEVLTVD